MKLFKRIKFYLISIIGAIFGTTLIVSLLSYKTQNNFKPSFFNYKSYMSTQNINVLRNVFDYKEFDSISEFSNSLINNKAAAGIGSDFLAVELINKNLIDKINYSVLFNNKDLEPMLGYDKLKSEYDLLIKNHKQVPQELEEQFKKATQARLLAKNYLKLVLRKEIFDHLTEYKLKNGSELWEYFFPYFSQDMVVSYNIKKVKIPQKNKNEDGSINLELYKDSFKSNDPEKSVISDTKALVNIMKILSQNNYNNWVITDAIRDNMLYGSSYWPLPNGRTETKFTGFIEDLPNNIDEPYKLMIDSFTSLIKDGTGFDIKDNKHISFIGDGLEIVNNIINPTRPDVNVAIMYNGDAIDAYYGSDNFPDVVEDGEIRSIKPKHNLLLVDGFVIAKSLSDESKNEYTQIISESFLSQAQKDHQIYKNLVNEKKIQPIVFNSSDLEIYKIQEYIREYQINKLFNEFKNQELLDLDINQEDKEILIKKYSNIINLTDLKNKKYLDLLNNNRLQFNSGQEVDLESRISIYQEIIKNTLNDNYQDYINKVLTILKDQNADIVFEINKLNSNNDYKLFNYYLTQDVKNNKHSISNYFEKDNLDQNKEQLINYLSRKIVYIDLSSDYILDNYLSLNNFDFINYVPTTDFDYEIVLRNYFMDSNEGYDKNTVEMYEILNNENVIHKSIQPVSDELLSKITTYYFNKTKS
ncbi:hypothetical protein [Mycoplasma leonicaptivi]|uniref:hypothetical protein n=1 Tax=Mycoplasma leonicaptivi TaxID=36742 RepID=UPI000686B69D|nr:hypothetical protein [Mycoplasma leonicaptivi]